MGNFEGLLCVPLLPSKWSIWGVQEFKNSRIQEFKNPEFRNSGILELPKWAILKAYSACHFCLQNGPFGEFKNSRIQEFKNPESRNSGILELPKLAILKAYSACHFCFQNGPFGEFKNSRIQESGIPEFRNSGTPEMGNFEGLLCVPLLPSKRSIWGVQHRVLSIGARANDS